ncbi:MAG: hypothetical protein J0H67_04995 [Rhodospirillales bacterium]|nr:hypothetical protein [Rhodospirillales bacterium]
MSTLTSLEVPSASEGTTGVTQNEVRWAPARSPGAEWSGADLQRAEQLSLVSVPVTLGAVALVDELCAAVAAWEAPNRKGTGTRGPAGLRALRKAVGAVVGGVLIAWRRTPARAVYRSVDRSAFSGGPVGFRQFVAAVDGMVALGLLAHASGIRFQIDWGDGASQHGYARRLRPTAALVGMAERHGVTPATIREDFRPEFPTVPPTVAAPLVLRPLPVAEWERRGVRARDLPVPQGEPWHRLAAEVEDFNAFVAEHDIRGCLPPRFRRVFHGDHRLYGRWHAAGSDGVYQQLSEAQRLGITINGDAVAEIDVRASHLTIMHGLLGLPMPEGDPYSVPGLEGQREVLKAWITATLGKGSPVRRWPRSAEDHVRDVPASMVAGVVLARYPFLAEPWRVVEHLRDLGDPRRLLTYRLMALEAEAVTAAMKVLRREGVLALPVHDSLIVPASSADRAEVAMREAFAEAVQAWPMTTRD